MKVKILGLQPGTYQKNDTYESYMMKQYNLLEEAVEKENPYFVMCPELMTGPFFAGVCEDKWFETAEPVDGPTSQGMISRAKKLGVHILYSFFERAVENGVTVYYNTLALASPTRGLIGIYHKNHIPWLETPTLNSYEKYYFKPGEGFSVFKLDNGLRVGMLLCYDRSFPETWRCLYLQDAQLICMAACTWGFRYDFYMNELRTRAFESHAFVMALNRAGDEQVENEIMERHHFGSGTIIGPGGDVIEQLDSTPWTYVCSEIDLEQIEEVSRATPWRRDRRPELYGIINAAGTNFSEQYVQTYKPDKEFDL